MPFDVDGALQAGASEDDVLGHLTSTRAFDVNGAMQAGASKRDIINYLATRPPKTSVPGMEKLGGTPPPAGQYTPPAPQEHTPFAEVDLPGAPGMKYAAESGNQIARGVEALAGGRNARGASQIIRGTGKAIAPGLIGALPAAPVSTLAGLAAGGGAQYGTEKGLNALGIDPDTAALSGDIAGITAGGLGSRIGRPTTPPIPIRPNQGATISTGGTGVGAGVPRPATPPPASRPPSTMGRNIATTGGTGIGAALGAATHIPGAPSAGAILGRAAAGKLYDRLLGPGETPPAGAPPPPSPSPVWKGTTSTAPTGTLSPLVGPGGPPTPAGSVNVEPPAGVPPEYLEGAKEGIAAQAANRYARTQQIVQTARKANIDIGKLTDTEIDALSRTIGSKRPVSPQSIKHIRAEWNKSTPQMAKGGVITSSKQPQDRIRGSANIPLSEAGQQEAANLGQRLAAKGFGSQRGDRIVSGKMDRARATAQSIAASAPYAKMLPPQSAVDSWSTGYEGEPSASADAPIDKHIRDAPNATPPNINPSIGAPPEPFDTWKQRYLTEGIQPLMRDFLARPNSRTVVVTHGRGIRLVRAWAKAGLPQDLSIDTNEMLRDDDKPAEVYRFAPAFRGQWSVAPVDLDKPGRFKSGIYLARHASTPWNAPEAPKPVQGDESPAARQIPT